MKHLGLISQKLAYAADDEPDIAMILDYAFQGIRIISWAFPLLYGAIWAGKNWQNVADYFIGQFE
ncbi:MAG TPA: hypothetical protein ENN80_04605 [Candidatus Hydrogenedentes bacterium]|nr:hypothetical protein [Candidatus Hydrogenedentota bacterium]